MRNFELSLTSAALALLPVIAFGRLALWLGGPFADARSRLALEEAAPEHRPEGGYVSSRDCRGCHPEQYASWHRSYHRTMTQVAGPEAVVGDFDGTELTAHVPATEPGGPREDRYRLSRRGDEYWVSAIDAAGASVGETRIVMTTGSHHHQIIWIRNGTDGRLVTLPWTWWIEEQRWIPRTDAFIAPPDDPFGLSYWTDVCIECHATQGRPRIAEDRRSDDPQVAELGIACEMCHGPAGAHVSDNRAPWTRYAKRGHEDPTIVNPKRLPPRESSSVCGRCHSVVSHPRTDTWGGHWNEFRPGDDLESEGRIVLHPESRDPLQRRVIAQHEREERGRFVRERFWSDGALRVTGRELSDVLTSPCFAGGEFSCLSCHSLHDYESRSDQLAPEMGGDAACLQCHKDYEGDASRHTRHEPDSAGSRCMNCHLPYTTYGLLTAIRSHRVSNPSAAAELATGRPNACNACHLDKTLAWTQEQLARDYGSARVPLDEAMREVASGPRWIATGDAGVRALAGWYMGWDAAREASGGDWMTPYLAELLADPYAAVRAVSFRSLRSVPGFADLDYDFVEAKGAVGDAARVHVQSLWARRAGDSSSRPVAPLAAADRSFDRESWAELLAGRDARPISLSE